MSEIIAICVLLALLLLMLLVMAFFYRMFKVWMRALLSETRVSLFELLGMRLRGNPPELLIDALAALTHRGVRASVQDVETAYVAHEGVDFTPAGLADLVQKRLSDE